MTETTELTTIERAEQALGFADLKGKLEELAKKSANIVTITNKAGRDECHSRLMDLKNQRVAIEKTGKAARDEATKYAKLVIEKEDALVAIISPEETRLKALRDEWDDARQREREEEERKERERVQAMVDAIAAINAIPTRLFGASVAELNAAIDALQDDDLSFADDVYLPSAEKAKADTIATLKEARDKRQALDDEAAAVAAAHEAQRLEREAEEARLAAERAAFEAEQAAAREAQAKAEDEARLAREEADRQAAEARAEADRAAQAERDRQAAELAEQQRKLDEQAAEQRQQAEESAQRAQEEQEARDLAAAEEQAARDAQAAQERAEREAIQAERDAVVILVDMPDGSRWGVPMMAVIRNLAHHVIKQNADTIDPEEALETVAKDFMGDHDWALDWAANNMDWSDVVAEAYQHKAPADVDYQEGWVNGEKSVITKQG